ncbi:FAD-dependent oxidoreductase [Brevibacillus sp. DP1.3A]|nr:FAD-dependent oxidoreductase [Brevibacillus sp. DP1.3A]UED74916.1 FAD-dependent oxidoreductase [Brevibacillus sp. DP1.3A]
MEFNRRFSKFPRVIVFCRRTQDVINAVKWARERGVRLRARSGRHSYEGFSAVNGGIIIDVSEMNKVKVDRKNLVAHVQTGIPLARVYRQLWNERVALPARTAPDVGVAGLTLGGGIGLLSRKYGLTCDNLKQVKMVVASGRRGAKTIVANKKKHSDLLWASQGGAGSAVSRVSPIATAYPHRKAETIYELSARWRNDSEQQRSIQWVKRFRRALRPFVVGDYVNFPDLQIKNWPEAYYGVNFARLKQVKRKYDPHNVFRFAQSIPVGK